MNYFPNRKRYVTPRGLLNDLKQLVSAVGKALGRASHQVKGHKRLYASSLAFKTILALIPVLAIITALLASDFLGPKREQLLDQIVDAIYPVDSQPGSSFFDPTEPQNLQQLNQVGKQQIRISLKKFANHARKVGFFGFLGFGLVVFLLLRDVENSFNFLWGVEKSRHFISQSIRHAIFLFVAPILAIFLLTLKGWVQSWNLFGHVLNGWLFFSLVPFLGLWAVCAWMYAWIPNLKVDRRAAIWSGFLTAILLEIAQRCISWYTLNVMAKSHIYGALWVIPVILVWFYLSWTIILFGAEVSFYLQKKRE
ncbi:MAG TPA: YihY/virulence factor BrkB family protein [bacterium]